MDLWEIFFDIFDPLPRQGPGDNGSTRKAYSMLSDLPASPRILDVGCGTGIQTIELGRISGGTVTGVDNHQHFLDVLRKNSDSSGLGERIKTVNGDMFKLEYPDETFDIIWTEGAIYILGFERALIEWKRMLKPRGYMVASDATWFKEGPPDEVRNFWDSEYPEMTTVEEKLLMIMNCGYEVIGHFSLPEEAWFEFYGNLKKSIKMKRNKYRNEPEAEEFIKGNLHEIELYERFREYYGYEFYVMRKI
jgi:ubiquinone/menaquinone biosynthesis C-methylase UbiE